jgi:steroid delta-isomerase-like uncharacterized protein
MNCRMAIIAGCLLLAGSAMGFAEGQDHVRENMALGRRVLEEIYGQGKIELVDHLYTDDFVDDSPGGGTGRALIKEAVKEFHTACPDLRMDIEDVFATQDKVVIRFVGIGTHTGPFNQTPPTGKAVRVRGITVLLVRDGKVKTEWTEYDRLGMLRQIGVIPN